MTCDKCNQRHLIADNLGWFNDHNVNIESIMQDKMELVERVWDRDDGLFMFVPKK